SRVTPIGKFDSGGRWRCIMGRTKTCWLRVSSWYFPRFADAGFNQGESSVKTQLSIGSRLFLASTVSALVVVFFALGAGADLGPTPAEVQVMRDKAVAFLKTRQNEDGSFSPKLGGPGISALIAAGCLRNGMSPEDPFVAKTLAYLEKKVHKDGGIYDKG